MNNFAFIHSFIHSYLFQFFFIFLYLSFFSLCLLPTHPQCTKRCTIAKWGTSYDIGRGISRGEIKKSDSMTGSSNGCVTLSDNQDTDVMLLSSRREKRKHIAQPHAGKQSSCSWTRIWEVLVSNIGRITGYLCLVPFPSLFFGMLIYCTVKRPP